jgi:hypothetical protein
VGRLDAGWGSWGLIEFQTGVVGDNLKLTIKKEPVQANRDRGNKTQIIILKQTPV